MLNPVKDTTEPRTFNSVPARYPLMKIAVVLFALCSVAAFLRVYHLGKHDFWHDEIWSIRLAQNLANPSDPPVYYELLHYVMKFFGTSEFWCRLPSAFFSTLAVVLLFFLGKLFFGARTGLLAAFIQSLSSYHIYYAQEARPYSLTLCLGLLSTYLVYRAVTERRIALWFFYVCVSLVTLYTDHTFAYGILLVLQSLVIFFHGKKQDRTMALVLFVPCILFLPFLPFMFSHLQDILSNRKWWIPKPDFLSVAQTFSTFNLSSPGKYSYVAFVIAQVAALIAYLENKSIRMNMSLCVLFFAVPIIVIYTVSRCFVAVYLDRIFLAFSPYYYLFLAVGLSRLHKKYILVLWIALYSVMSLVSWNAYLTTTTVKKPFHRAVRFIDSNFRAGDVFVVTGGSGDQYPAQFYSRGKQIADKMIIVSMPMNAHREASLHAARRIWFLSAPWAGKWSPLDKDIQLLKEYLDTHFTSESYTDFSGGVCVYLYRTQPH